MLRATIALLTLAAAVLYGTLAVRCAGDTWRVHKQWNRVPALVTSTAGFPAVEVELKRGETVERKQVHADVDYFLAPFQHRDIFVDPGDPSRARLAGFFETATPLLAFFAAMAVNFGVACFIMKAPAMERLQDPVPPEWAGKWNWFSQPPRQESPDALVLKQPASAWRMSALWALLALLVILAIAYSDRPLWVRQCYPTVFFLGFLGMGLSAIHTRTYALAVGENGVRAKSAVGWKQVPWTEIARLEDETFRFVQWDKITRSYENRGFQSPLRSLVLRDANGKKLMGISRDLQPRETRDAVLRFISERTGLQPVSVEKQSELG